MSKLRLCCIRLRLVGLTTLVSTSAFAAIHPELHNSPVEQSVSSQHLETGEVPDGLTSSEWASIQSQVTAGKYRAHKTDNDGFDSSNSAHGWRIQ